jgi:hypothetical protein
MDPFTDNALRIAAIGIGATAFMDVWLLLLRAIGIPGLDFTLVGRWAGHLAQGRWFHDSIARAQPVPGEHALGWLVHYAVGIGFAALAVAVIGTGWIAQPTVWPAVAVGLATVAAPFLLMQPAMGAGVASSRTAAPGRNRLRSALNHLAFGVGLYVAAAITARLLQ